MIQEMLVRRLCDFEAALRTKRMLRQFPVGSFVKLHVACEKLGQVTAEFERDEMQGVWMVKKYHAEDDLFVLLRPTDKAWTNVGPFCLSRAPR